MSNILVTGSNGQVGSEIKSLHTNFKNYSFIFTDKEELDICNYSKVREFIAIYDIKIIINCAAYTEVDKAEEQIELADKINHLAVKNFASIAKEKNIKLIHISTDYVFDGTNYIPYIETDTPNPQSVYGATKLAGENSLKEINPSNSIIIRTSWVYSKYGNNFVKTMLRLAKERNELSVVIDQIGSPTYARDLAQTILEIIEKIKNRKVEIFHYSNLGVCSWYDFARAIFEINDIKLELSSIETSNYPTSAKRPNYSVLNKTKIKNNFNIEIPNWQDSLKEFLLNSSR